MTRYMVSVNEEISNSLIRLSEKKSKSISGIIQELINEALELREDLYWSKIADEAETRAIGKELIAAEIVWGKCDLK